MPPAFVIEFAALLGCGPAAALLVTVGGALVRRQRARGVAALAAMAAAAYVHHRLGGTIGYFAWPFQGLPIGAAVLTYAVVKVSVMAVAAPLVARRRIDRAWPRILLREGPMYCIGAGLAIGLVEMIAQRSWAIVPVAAIPLFFAYRRYADHLDRLEEAHRRREVAEHLQDGLALVVRTGEVILWNDALEQLLGCSRSAVVGRPLGTGVLALNETTLPRDVAETLSDRRARTSRTVFRSKGAVRTFDVKLVPVDAGVTLVWHDVTERMQTEQALQQDAERFSRAGAGAQDGLWECDLRSRVLHVSDRWKALVGLPVDASVSCLDDWWNRVHPDEVASLMEAMKAHLTQGTPHLEHEHRMRHEDGSYRWVLCRGMADGDDRRRLRIAGSVTDLTDRMRDEHRFRTSGFRDPLTGLRNRADFLEVLSVRLDDYRRGNASERFAVLFLDLDRFKVINDSLGHLAGDELLVAVSRRLESCVRHHDYLGRLGGDEFAVLLTNAGDEPQVNVVALRIQDALRAPFLVAGREVFTSVSIGVAFSHRDYTKPHEIMRDADTAMYHAKANGKARHEVFDAAMHARARDRHDLENDLRHAINNRDFEVHYQPIVFLASGMCVGFESLVRWTRAGKPVSPATFIPIAEELGVINELGTWILNEACRTFAGWQRRFPEAGLNCITVNVSSRQLSQPDFPSIVHEALRTSGLKSSDLRIEVTETALMDNAHIAGMVLGDLRDYGVKIYLDDFGTGCSSLSHLHKLPVDALKIDRSFVMSLLLPDRPAIVESILALARTLRTSVVAEGIESEVQARELERLGCTHAQGYLFSRPLSNAAAEQLVMENRPLGPKAVAERSRDRLTTDYLTVHENATLH